MKVFLTGATGFIGSHIAKRLISENHEVVALKRKSSNLKKCEELSPSLVWLDTGEEWEQEVMDWCPDVILHSAWAGVTAEERNDWELQQENLSFVDSLLNIARVCRCSKFIGLGSQAEYGDIRSKVNEYCMLRPTSAYGRVKIEVQRRIQRTCEQASIRWYWLRIFSLFGYDQSATWLIPGLISDMLDPKKQEKDMTAGEQVYSYLDVSDFTYAVKLVLKDNAASGIYNVSSENYISIRELATLIRNMVNPEFRLNFGVLPYRVHQSMFVGGDSRKFISAFGKFEYTPLKKSLIDIITYQKKIHEGL